MALDDIYASLDLLEETVAELEQELDAADERNQTIMQNAVVEAIQKTKADTKAEMDKTLKAEIAKAVKDVKAQAKANQTPDLFSQTWANPVSVAKPSNDKNNVLLAQKLDNTIERVQALLREAGA